jgi:protoporphyrinogen oxidase
MSKTKIAILGGGPSGLFLFKSLLSKNTKDIEIEIFEKKMQLGAGMPYSNAGANDEHITNVSDNEIPGLVSSIGEWAKSASKETLRKYNILRKMKASFLSTMFLKKTLKIFSGKRTPGSMRRLNT